MTKVLKIVFKMALLSVLVVRGSPAVHGSPISCFAAQETGIAKAVPMNFDKYLSDTDKMIYIQPPIGTYWVILEGSFTLYKPVPGASIAMWLDFAPYSPYNSYGCDRCITLIRTDASVLFTNIMAQRHRPLVIAYPNRLVIAVSPSHGGLPMPVQTWTRILVVEKLLNSTH